MQTHPNVELADDPAESLPRPSSRRTKLAVAGVALASAGALALTPVIATPTLPDVQVDRIELARTDAYAMTALDSAFGPYGALVKNLYGEIVTGRDVDVRIDHRERLDPDDPDSPWNMPANDPNRYTWEKQFQDSLINNVSNASNNLVQTLTNETVHAGFANAIQNLADPERLLGVLGNLPEYAERFTASGDLGGDFLENAFATLLGTDGQDGALQRTLTLLSEGQFFAAFSEINYWFLVEGLSAGRQSQIDGGILSLPGDILLDLGLDPLANVLGHSSMEEYGLSANGGLLGRSVIGNLGRALLAPPITAIFQTMEILDDVQKFVKEEDFDLAIAELVAAPAKITGAFLTGYVPGPLMDFSMEAGRGQAFPGIFSPTGPLDFVFNQLPNEIATNLAAQKLPVPGDDDDEDGEGEDEGEGTPESPAALVSATDTKVDRKTVAINVDGSAPETPVTEAPAKDAPVTEGEADETGVVTEGTDDAVVEVEDGTADEASDAKELTSKDRISLLREQAAEKRAERVEQRKERISNARDAVQRVGSNIRKGLGLPDRAQKPGTSKAGNDGGNDDSSKSESSSKSKSESKSESKSGGSDD